MNKQRYGIATNGPHKGQLTPCNAKDPDKCKNHEPGSHRDYTPEEAQSKQEELTREHVFKHVGSNENLGHHPASLHENASHLSKEKAMGVLKKAASESNKTLGGESEEKLRKSINTNIEDSFYDEIDEFDVNHGNSDLYGIDADDLDAFSNKIFDSFPGSENATPEYRRRFVDAMNTEIRDKNDYASDQVYGIDDGNVDRILMNVRSRMRGENPPLRGVEDGERDPFALTKTGVDPASNNVLDSEDVRDVMVRFDKANNRSAYYEIPASKTNEFADALLENVNGGTQMGEDYRDKFRAAVNLELRAQNEHPGGRSRWPSCRGIDDGWTELFTENLVRRMRGMETRKRD